MSRLYQKFKDSVHPPAQPPRPPIPSWSKQDAFGQMQRRTSKPDTTVMRVNAVYYPNYRIYRGDHESPATLNYGCITHVFYAFAKVAPDGRVLVCFIQFLSNKCFHENGRHNLGSSHKKLIDDCSFRTNTLISREKSTVSQKAVWVLFYV